MHWAAKKTSSSNELGNEGTRVCESCHGQCVQERMPNTLDHSKVRNTWTHMYLSKSNLLCRYIIHLALGEDRVCIHHSPQTIEQSCHIDTGVLFPSLCP
jgi:hypothetical protein